MSRTIISGRAYPLGLDNVDTDLIIGAEHLKTLSRVGLGRHAFEALRTEEGNIFDDPRFRGASILVAGKNFGCGSSREHAVWALKDLGVEAVIAGSFSDIFAGNTLKNGLAAIALGPASLALVLEQAKRGVISIDFSHLTINFGDRNLHFAMDMHQRNQLISGGDEIGMTLGCVPDIERFEQGRPCYLSS